MPRTASALPRSVVASGAAEHRPARRRRRRRRSYAPFCKHLFVPCFLPDAVVEAVPITPDNRHLLRSDYEVRVRARARHLLRSY